MENNSEYKKNNNILNDKTKCMIVNDEDPEIFWNSAVLVIAIILFGILMFYKLKNNSGNCVNYGNLPGTLDETSIFNSIP